MKVVFISNFFNHHQKYLSDSLYDELNGSFTFIETSEIPKERLELGYKADWNEAYIINIEQNERILSDLIEDADVLICGACTSEIDNAVIQSGKLVFRYWERPLKENDSFLRNIVRYFKWRLKFSKNKNDYILCASAYTASDYNKFGLFENRTYKWGYFPERRLYEIDNLMSKKKKHTILWAGRLLDWKHPNLAINMACRLKAAGVEFELNIIGTGDLRDELLRKIEENNLGDRVHLLGAMTPEDVRSYMETSQIFLFTSDRREGWGAVLNEAMNSGCAVIASKEAGAVPFLVNHGKNGLIYSTNNEDELYENLLSLINDHNKATFLGRNAYETISTVWNAECAAERFVKLAEIILSEQPIHNLFLDGPCSKANS